MAAGGDRRGPVADQPGTRRGRGRHGEQGRERRPAGRRLRRGRHRDRTTAYPEAVRIALEQVDEVGDAEWIWLLHDDSNPAPDALERLLAAAADDPGAEILGPKLREWPSLKRLLEVGVTISGTGRRETNLEPGEYDQGQHDEVRDVLAVNTAGMLVRRQVLEELGGFDDNLPIFGNDIDFGWRAASRGHRTVVVPQAIVFHAEAAHRGTRRTPLTGRHTHYQERRAALFTLLANAPARKLPWQVVRLFFGTLLRMVGFFVVRSPGEALDDLAALFSVYVSPLDVLAARRDATLLGRRRPEAPARAVVAALPARSRLRRRHPRRCVQPGSGRRRPTAVREGVGRPGPDPPARRRRGRGSRGHRVRRAVLHQPAGRRAGGRRGALPVRCP